MQFLQTHWSKEWAAKIKKRLKVLTLNSRININGRICLTRINRKTHKSTLRFQIRIKDSNIVENKSRRTGKLMRSCLGFARFKLSCRWRSSYSIKASNWRTRFNKNLAQKSQPWQSGICYVPTSDVNPARLPTTVFRLWISYIQSVIQTFCLF